MGNRGYITNEVERKMFFGEFKHNVDDKGRMSIPAKFRDDLGDNFFVTKGLDQCLFIFPMTEWEAFQAKLKQLPLSNANARAFKRFFNASAIDCTLDKQGRINISQPLREHALVEKEVNIIGVGDRIEIWSRDAWESYNAPDNLSYDDIAEQMEELGI